MLFESDFLVGFAGVAVLARQFFGSHHPDILADDAQAHGSSGFADERLLELIGARHFGNEFGRLAVGAIDFFFRLFHFLGDLTVDVFFVNQINRPNFFFLLHVMTSECAAVEEDDLILAAKGGLAGMGAFAEADREDTVRSGTVSDPPNVASDDESNNRARSRRDEDGLSPGASFLDVALASKNGDFDTLRFGF